MIHWLTHMTSDGVLPMGRGLAAFLTAAALALALGRPVIRILRRWKIGERTEKTPIEDEVLRDRITSKSGTPTMGGLIIGASLFLACLLWGNLLDPQLWLALAAFGALSAVGMVDDWMKLTGRGNGLKVRYKLLVQGLVGVGLGTVIVLGQPSRWSAASAWVPWLPAGLVAEALVLWCALVVATMSNAVNVTDGLDGLAGGLSVVALIPLCWVIIQPGAGATGASGEILIYIGALAGALLGFLWHNWHPARVFMGDTGSLAVGGSIGLVALLTRTELALPLIALVFLVEFGSSVLQVVWFKVTGRRILPIAPVHHIWQRRGLPETHIVFRFCLIGLFVVLATTPIL